MIRRITISIILLTWLTSKVYSAGGFAPIPSEEPTSAYGASQSNRLIGSILLIQNNKFEEAYKTLLNLSQNGVDEAERQNLLGYTARSFGDYVAAAKHYKIALNIDPTNSDALEYQGELFLTLGDIKNARINLQKLKEQCFLICPTQYEQLKDAISQAQ